METTEQSAGAGGDQEVVDVQPEPPSEPSLSPELRQGGQRSLIRVAMTTSL